MAWCWELGFVKRCCKWSKRAYFGGGLGVVVSGGWWWWIDWLLGKDTSRFFDVGAFFEGVYGIQRVPKTLCTPYGWLWFWGSLRLWVSVFDDYSSTAKSGLSLSY